MSTSILNQNLESSLPEGFSFPHQTSFYSGKVRDVYEINDRYLLMVATDRISAFDKILGREIPYKGHVLNQITTYMLNETKDVCPNWFIESPLPNILIGYRCKRFMVEVIVRGNLCGSAWRIYKDGGRTICGAKMQDGLKENDFFDEPIVTPTTKNQHGHDEDITKEEIIAQGSMTESEWNQVSGYALALFKKGNQLVSRRGLIMADTKYEFGTYNGQVMLMDELHTPDSSRFFHSKDFNKNQLDGRKQEHLSKEFVREWLMEQGFTGQDNQEIPYMSDEFVMSVHDKYTDLFEQVMGRPFAPSYSTPEKVIEKCKKVLAVYEMY